MRLPVSLVLVCALTLGASACSMCAKKTEAVLEQVEPAVTLATEGAEPAQVAEGAAAHAGDTITTDEAGAARLRFANGSSIKLGPNSSLYLEGGPEGLQARRVRLLFGTIDAKGAGKSLLVMTTLGPVEFGDDSSEVTITSGDDGLTVRTLLGEVRMGERIIGEGVSLSLDQSGIVFGDQVDAGVVEDAGAVADLGTTGPVTITLKSGRGVQKKSGGKGRKLRVKIGDPLMEQDQVFVNRNASMALGEIGEISFGRRSQVMIGGAAVAGVAPLLEPLRGDASLTMKAGARHSLSLGAVRADVSASPGGADVELRRDKASSRVRVYAGKVTLVDAAGKKVEVGANQSAVINSKGESRVRAVPDEPLKVTAGVRRVLSAKRLPPVTFSWKEIKGGGPYVIEIARDAAFSKLVVVAQVPSTSYTSDRIGSGTYHWRVRNDKGKDPARSVSFGRDRSSASGDARKNVVRASGERTVILYQQFQTPQLTFKWPEREDATQYRIALYQDGKFDAPTIERVTKEASLKLAGGLLKDGRYLWAVSSLSAAGKVASTSDMYDLEVKYDSNEMLLRVMTPAVNARVAGKTIETRGMVPPGATLTINGKPVQPDAQGRFVSQIAVPKHAPFIFYKLGSVLFVRPVRR